jgi:hypothetical protein
MPLSAYGVLKGRACPALGFGVFAAEPERVEGARSILHKAAGEPTRLDNCLLANFFG